MLIYSAICSVDGYTVDASGSFAWAAPDEQVHAYVNESEASIGTYLYGRRMYETMRSWQDVTTGPPAVTAFAQLWRAADKVVFSSTLETVDTGRTRLVRRFEAGEVRALVESAGHAVSIGGPTLAAAAITAGLVAEYRLLLVPVSVGGGLSALPPDTFLRLRLLETREFAGGTVLLRYSPEA